jgi:hypothetical protein
MTAASKGTVLVGIGALLAALARTACLVNRDNSGEVTQHRFPTQSRKQGRLSS